MAVFEGVDIGLLLALFLKTGLAIGIDAPLGNNVSSTAGWKGDELDLGMARCNKSGDWNLTGAEGTPAEPGCQGELAGLCLHLRKDL